jgi:hypothetical protein
VVQHIYDKICNTIGTMTTHRYIPIVLVGNKCDLDHDRAVSCEEGRQLAQEWQCAFIEASAKHNENIKAAFHQLLQQVQENEGPAKVLDVGLCEKISAWWWWWWCCCGCCGGGGPGGSEYEPIEDQNGSMMGSPVAGKGKRFRRYPERRPGRSGSGGGYDGGGGGHRTKTRTSSAASDYFLGYGGDGDRHHHDGPEGHCGGHECCVRCCTLTALSQKRLYYLVGVCTLLMMVVGAGSMFTGFQIAIEADNSVPSIPSHHNSSTNHTNHTTVFSSSSGSGGGGASLFLLPSYSSSSSSSSPSSPFASLRPSSATESTESFESFESSASPASSAISSSSASSASPASSTSNTNSAPVPWKPVNPSNLEGAWFAYGASG